MKIITLNTKAVLLDRIQCMRNSLEEINDNIIVLVNQRLVCCGNSNSTSPPSPCSQAVTSGGEGIQVDFVNLGLTTGIVVLDYEAYNVPDRFVVEYNNVIVIDTGYRGTSSYNTDLFALTGQNILGEGVGSAQFNKNLSSQSVAKVTVYGPLAGTSWFYTLSCPNQGASSSTSPSSNSPSSSPPSLNAAQWSDGQSVEWSDGQNLEFS